MASGFLRTGGCSLVGNRLLVLNVTDGYPKSLGSCAKNSGMRGVRRNGVASQLGQPTISFEFRA